jgi:hypothetical protein
VTDTAHHPTDRKVRCRYVRMNGERCTGEAIDPLEDIVLCPKHAMRAHHVWLRYYKAARARTA